MDVIGVHGRNIDQIMECTKFAVVPLGSVAYHGPHSPLDGKYRIYAAMRLARRPGR